jgi:hypothetical protein
VPLVEAIGDVSELVWDLDLDGYAADGNDLVYRTAVDVRDALLRPLQPSDILVTKVMVGVFGCVPACETHFKRGFGGLHGWASHR